MHRQGIEPMICGTLRIAGRAAGNLRRLGVEARRRAVRSLCGKVFERFHGKVTRWFTFNEPIVVQTRVYLDALRWPYEQNTST